MISWSDPTPKGSAWQAAASAPRPTPSQWAPDEIGGASTDGAAHQPKGEEEWLEEVELARSEGFGAGLAEGESRGRRAERERVSSAVRALEEAVRAMHENEARWTDTLEDNTAALAVAVARQIIGRELRTDRAPVVDLVRKALAEFPAEEALRVRLHPHDLSLLSVAAPGGEPPAVAPGRSVRWIADPAVEPGGCLVEGRERIADARLGHALDRVYKALSDV